MDTISYKTVSANKATVNKEWLLVDAEGEVLGRLASKVAFLLRGKHKTNFTPHVDCGDNVVIINADKVRLTGNKTEEKTYITHSGYPGGQKEIPFKRWIKEHPTRIVEWAIEGMLPKNRLGSAIKGNLYVYSGAEHQQTAQQPKLIKLDTIK